MMMREVRWERMFPDELETAFAACPLAYFPYGMCEPHGPQNAIGLDALKAHAVCVLAARSGGGIVAPADYWHIHELGGYAGWGAKYVGEIERSWMTVMPPWQHFRNVLYHVRQAEVLGFKAALFFTGHYGPNYVDLETLIDLVQPHVGTRLYALPSFEANQPGFSDGLNADHAGKVETSLLWALEPDCVDMSRLPPPGDAARPLAMGPDAPEADRRIGERMAADEARYLCEKGQTLIADYDRLLPEHTLRTFAQVEALWQEVIHPRLYDLLTMQPDWGPEYWGEAPPSEDSRWRTNYPIPEQM